MHKFVPMLLRVQENTNTTDHNEDTEALMVFNDMLLKQLKLLRLYMIADKGHMKTYKAAAKSRCHISALRCFYTASETAQKSCMNSFMPSKSSCCPILSNMTYSLFTGIQQH